MLDIVKPRTKGKITLSDLKKCKMTPLFFDTFFNLEKYLEHEQKEAGGISARVSKKCDKTPSNACHLLNSY